MNQIGHTGMIIGIALLALGGIACQGQDPDSVSASPDHGTATRSFEHGTATSSLVDGLIVSEVRDGDGVLVASGEWQVEEREGRIETGQQSMVSKLAPGTALTPGLANITTYNVWADRSMPASADEIPYDGLECEPCRGSQCCSCEGGSHCCINQICYNRELGTFELRIDCSPPGSCGSAPPPPPSCSDGCGGCGCCDGNCCI